MSGSAPFTTTGGSEIQARSLEALASLLRTLDGSTDLQAVAERALLTLAGQLLVQRAAFYVAEESGFSLRATVGTGRNRELPAVWHIPEPVQTALDVSETGVLEVDDLGADLDPFVGASFDRIARLSNGDQTVGAVLLGGALHARGLQDPDYQLLRTMGIVIGTTVHRVRVQEALERSHRRLEQAELIRSSVMDHVSHEFNTPLMVLKSVGDLLSDSGGAEREELLSMHAEAVTRLEALVQSILRLARDSQHEADPERIRAEDVVREIIAPWYAKLTPPSGTLRSSDLSGVGCVQAEPTRISSILDALHANAVEAVRDQAAQVWVNVYAAPADWWTAQDHLARLDHYTGSVGAAWHGLTSPPTPDPHGCELILEVVDLGRGIPDTDQERVFEPFSQAVNSASLGVAGSGMGLPTARRFAEELGGLVVLRSRENHGTIAALILPVGTD